MGEQKIREKAGADGIEVSRIKVDDGCYEVEGRSRHGQNLDVHYNPETGERISVDSNDSNGNGNNRASDGGKAARRDEDARGTRGAASRTMPPVDRDGRALRP